MPDDMGTFRVDVEIENPARPGERRALKSVLVDTGAELSWVPAEVLESLGIERYNTWHFRQADGTILERRTGAAFIHVAGKRTSDDVVFGEPGDLPDELAAELGVLLCRIEREIRALGNIGRVHVCRWGDGGEHLHWWFMARPARIPQLIGSFAAIWDDILPPVPEEVRQADLARLAAALG